MWEKLVAVLAEMLETYKMVLELSRRKRDILVTVQTKKLESLTKEEELLIIKLGGLEQRRQATLADLADACNVESDGLTLKALEEIAEQPIVDTLHRLDVEFTAVARELGNLNKLNTQLIEQSLDFVNYNLNILTQNCAGDTYQPKGQAGSSSQSRIIFDTKV